MAQFKHARTRNGCMRPLHALFQPQWQSCQRADATASSTEALPRSARVMWTKIHAFKASLRPCQSSKRSRRGARPLCAPGPAPPTPRQARRRANPRNGVRAEAPRVHRTLQTAARRRGRRAHGHIALGEAGRGATSARVDASEIGSSQAAMASMTPMHEWLSRGRHGSSRS